MLCGGASIIYKTSWQKIGRFLGTDVFYQLFYNSFVI